MIYTRNLTFSYSNTKTFTFPNLGLEKGESLLINGISGCGKTTFLHLLAGLKRPKSGMVNINGEDITTLSSTDMDRFRGKHIGIVHQQPHFIQSLNILDNLLISPFADNIEKAKTVAKRLAIMQCLDQLPYQLSEGQKQRAGIARAVMHSPSLLLADEPTSALDDMNCKTVIDLIREEAQINKSTLIIVTHDNRLKSVIQNSVQLNDLNKA